jgi:adenylate cyclase
MAVRAAPDYGLAHATLAAVLSTLMQTDRLRLTDADRRQLVSEGHEAIDRALDLDDQNPHILTRLAGSYCLFGEAEAALRVAQRATLLAPNSAEAQFALAFAYFMLGHTDEAIEAFSKQDRIGLADNARMMGQMLLGICLFIEGRSQEAEQAIDRSLAYQPNFYLSLRWKAIIAAELGKERSAKAAVSSLLNAEPGKSIDDYLDSPRHLPIEHPRKYQAIEILRRLLEETEGNT